MKKGQKQLKAREEDLDDRDSRHVRRELRKELKDKLAERSREFILTKKTAEKRKPLHVLFILLIVLAAAFFGKELFGLSEGAEWFHLLRVPVAGAALAAAVVFYIRWNDRWFRQHADEEFRLKRLELDIDRASWVVEMALEWRDEKGLELPEELLSRLTEDLFRGTGRPPATRHPTEELASALLAASSGLTLALPGLGELVLDRKGVKEFRKAAGEQSENA